jgi:hypothetical protein
MPGFPGIHCDVICPILQIDFVHSETSRRELALLTLLLEEKVLGRVFNLIERKLFVCVQLISFLFFPFLVNNLVV